MKKLLLSVFLLAGLVFITTPDARAQLGVQGGLNIANFNDTDDSFDSRSGIMAGLTYDLGIPMSPITIQPGVFYAQKGAKYSGGDVETTAKLDYLEIPVVAKFAFILDNPMLTPHVYFGPYLGLNMNAEQEGTPDFEDEVKGTDFGVVVGAGADITKFNVGVRYSAGLTNAFEEGDGKNGVFSVVAGINF
ncbi:Outer membrane protein beta-barrel domain-containing protein [Fodinibius roseus]|uniref:Outer membrane protein beta-barrel domain-containing protein n=1 Tax=Fodinibius roseus TaxID=1194090 RepID=A0A1M5ACL9_9BACT|nr:porin family protein [Fodinibius roseus]SHF28040.1 Outer membrane protein beta-barrel domain-containing protein [Fodinibius roseus]